MQDEVLAKLSQAVAAPALMAHVEEFARRVKLSGTPEERESLAYIRARLDAFGYHTTLLEHDAYISLPGRARVEAGGRELTAITHSFSRPSAPGGTRGPLVYLGNGAPKAFEENEIRGKIVLVEGIASPAVSLRASEAGAAGQLHISPHQYLHEMCISPVWGSPSSRSRGRLPRTVVCTVAKEDGDALRRRLAGGEAVTGVLEAKIDTGWRKTPILVAEMGAPDDGADDGTEDAPFVMFSGHHDTWHYGVMDNGTANATMLECARLLAGERAGWRRGLRLCFWSGHSHGRYSGSGWYADEYWDELERRCLAHVNVDSTGAKGNTYLGGAPSVAELTALARDAVTTQAGQEITGERMSRAGDQSFWGIGIPSMFMSMGQQEEGEDAASSVMGRGGAKRGAGLGWWWHTPYDLIDKIEPDLLVRDTRIFVHTLWRLLHEVVVPLDYAAHAEHLLRELATHGEGLEGRFDLQPVIARATALRDKAAALRELADPGPERAAAINAALRAVSRAMVPLDYTGGDRFEPDPALPMPAYPLLQPLRRLASLPAGSDQARFLTVTLTRIRNRFVHALGEADAALDAVLTNRQAAAAPHAPQPVASPPPRAAKRVKGRP